jgi:hypothetical protein
MKTTGLTLAEAVKSGRAFRNQRWNTDRDFRHYDNAYVSVSEALSSEWEIQPLPPKQTWTREEVEGIKTDILSGASGWMVGHVREAFERAGF